ncbi:OLC1v1025611C1 [Oldenlandia corymbosa var. corymbosa]|uniref:beta-N-acetylhexosaminidase n=1 Tax=Oldenlandia corymbosa var. corymbosa TaxID=529605 RepID=A0AAV1C822_OLDCO|nr:OLC1v1025611C1 [Oldenlandia corymbosa var. corymbosa]
MEYVSTKLTWEKVDDLKMETCYIAPDYASEVKIFQLPWTPAPVEEQPSEEEIARKAERKQRQVQRLRGWLKPEAKRTSRITELENEIRGLDFLVKQLQHVPENDVPAFLRDTGYASKQEIESNLLHVPDKMLTSEKLFLNVLKDKKRQLFLKSTAEARQQAKQRKLEEDFMMGWSGRVEGIVLGFFLVNILVISVAGADDIQSLKIWPMPESVSCGQGTLYLDIQGFELKTEGSSYVDASGILVEGFSRLLDVIKGVHVIQSKVISGFSPSLVIKGIRVVILSPSDELQHGVDESYKLSVPMQGSPIYAYIEAQTVYGALHGFETFSQLCSYSFETRLIEVHQAPWTIADKPRFPYRGLLIDTSRHFLPVPIIKKIIDSMAYAKLNVLHWHIVDTQSFPLEIPSYPMLWKGAYSSSERYTFDEAAEIVSYAKRRGINVLAEIDVPGHAESWGIGYASLWPSRTCRQPLDISNNFTFQVIDGILSDFSKVFHYKFVHLGGDEVDTSCWRFTPRVALWLLQQGMSESQAYEYFVLKAQQIALSHGYEIINWEETFNNFGSKLNPKTVVHNWLGGGVAQKVVAAGLRCIVSNQDKWYLDHLDATWQGFYSNEPLTNITIPAQQALVLGGEVCMWGEHIDGSDIEQTIWPRAAAAAERLWTPYEKLAKNPQEVAARLAHFRCLLNQRGVAAAPLAGLGRVAPYGPGSCYQQ